MFIDCEDCGEGQCLVQQIIVHVAVFADGTAEAVFSDPVCPVRRIHRQLAASDQYHLFRFLAVAQTLNVRSSLPNIANECAKD